jgi:predicted transcriptional regulator
MPDKNPTPDPRAESDGTKAENCILLWLLDDEQQRPWSIDEIAREYGDRATAITAIANLTGTGLIHRMGDFVFASRTAIRFNQIDS